MIAVDDGRDEHDLADERAHHHVRVTEAGLVGVEQDLVLGPERREQRRAGQRQAADQVGGVGGRHVLLQAAHLAHVVGADGVDDRAGAEEQQTLERRVGEQVEEPGGVAADRQRAGHVGELADRREGEHLLDVVGDQRHAGRAHHGDGREYADQVERRGRRLEHRVEARDQVDAGGDHRGGVDQRGHRRRAGHRVGQPDVQRELRALADRAAEDQHRARDDHAGADLARPRPRG
jgi:hypothetical protein